MLLRCFDDFFSCKTTPSPDRSIAWLLWFCRPKIKALFSSRLLTNFFLRQKKGWFWGQPRAKTKALCTRSENSDLDFLFGLKPNFWADEIFWRKGHCTAERKTGRHTLIFFFHYFRFFVDYFSFSCSKGRRLSKDQQIWLNKGLDEMLFQTQIFLVRWFFQRSRWGPPALGLELLFLMVVCGRNSTQQYLEVERALLMLWFLAQSTKISPRFFWFFK